MCFFESIGIVFHYESQGFVLSDSTPYLPDFYLPQYSTYAEVKPYQLTAEERRKCELLAVAADKDVLLLVGPPDFTSYETLDPSWLQITGGKFIERSSLVDIDYAHENRFYTDDELPRRIEEGLFSKKYREAVYASRAARFDGSG